MVRFGRLEPADPVDVDGLAARHAALYNELADEYVRRAAALGSVTRQSLARLVQVSPSGGGTALDIGCGAGVVSEVLADLGYDVTAIDVAPRMASACRERVPSARILAGDYLTTPVGDRFQAIVTFAFIHLFPRPLAIGCLGKMRRELAPEGCLLIGTTLHAVPREGLERKCDYPGAPARFRRRWTEKDFLAAIAEADLVVVDACRHEDPFGKCWFDAVVRPRPART